MTDTKTLEARTEAGGGWRPIETAPKDGKGILLFCDDEIVSTHWGMSDFSRGYGWLNTVILYQNNPNENEGFCLWGLNPTHWQPLPAPPKVTD